MTRNSNVVLSGIEYFEIWSLYIYLEKKKRYTKDILQMNYKRIKFPSVRSIKYSFRDVNLIFKKKKEEKREWKVIKSKLKSYGVIEIRLKIVTITFHRYLRLRENLRIYTIFIQYQKVRLNIFLRLVFRIKKRFVENIEDTSLFNRSSPPSRTRRTRRWRASKPRVNWTRGTSRRA